MTIVVTDIEKIIEILDNIGQCTACGREDEDGVSIDIVHWGIGNSVITKICTIAFKIGDNESIMKVKDYWYTLAFRSQWKFSKFIYNHCDDMNLIVEFTKALVDGCSKDEYNFNVFLDQIRDESLRNYLKALI